MSICPFAIGAIAARPFFTPNAGIGQCLKEQCEIWIATDEENGVCSVKSIAIATTPVVMNIKNSLSNAKVK